MPWGAPKTNWTPPDGVTDTDFNRIEGNIDSLDKRGKIVPAGGTANALTVSTGGDFRLEFGQIIRFQAVANNTAAMTLNPDGKGVIPLKFHNGAIVDVPVGMVKAWRTYDAWYDSGVPCFFLLARGSGNALPAEVLAGKEVTTDNGPIVGTMKAHTGALNRITAAGAIDGASTPGHFYSRPETGFFDGLDGWVDVADANFISSNIKKDVTVLGRLGTGPKYAIGDDIPFSSLGLAVAPMTYPETYSSNTVTGSGFDSLGNYFYAKIEGGGLVTKITPGGVKTTLAVTAYGLTVKDDHLYFAIGTNAYKYRCSDLTQVWVRSLGTSCYSTAKYGSYVYVASYPGWIYKLNDSDGSVATSINYGQGQSIEPYNSPMVVDANDLYVVTYDNNNYYNQLTRYRLTDLNILASKLVNGGRSQMALDSNYVYCDQGVHTRTLSAGYAVSFGVTMAGVDVVGGAICYCNTTDFFKRLQASINTTQYTVPSLTGSPARLSIDPITGNSYIAGASKIIAINEKLKVTS